MARVTKRELNQRTAAVLDQVTDAEDVVVTERGMPRWRVSAFRGQGSRLAQLESEGRYTPAASNPASWPSRPGGPIYTDAQVEALLDEISGDH